MMMDLLPYVLFALLVGAVFLIISGGFLVSANYLRKEGARTAKR